MPIWIKFNEKSVFLSLIELRGALFKYVYCWYHMLYNVPRNSHINVICLDYNRVIKFCLNN